jgi:tRNA pseudouridine55 synthase
MGIIFLNKKTGITSFSALGEIKRALGTPKVGHTGTLDKFASGLLVVLTGGSLKLCGLFSGLDKQYIGKIRFGIETDTLDPEGEETAQAPLPDREKVENALLQFTGEILQAPPAYSALHVNGKRAWELARSGKTPEMKKRPVTIYKMELRSWDPPFAEIFVHCSSGVYIRSLARDIALAAESRAHLRELVRTKVASFTLEMAEKDENTYNPRPVDKKIISALSIPCFDITPHDARKIFHGKPLEPILKGSEISFTPAESDFRAAVFNGEELSAIVEIKNGEWKYGCVLC